MKKIEGACREVCEATEFVSIITIGDDGPQVVGNWGEYMRVLGIKEDVLIFPAGRYRQTEQNLRNNNRIQLLVASKTVQGSGGSAGQGCLIIGTGEILTSGETVDAVKAKFRWARGALVVHVEDVKVQL
jgi:predicted pyridoxine 5'-phosphate oxidase superfamily flavin-nucleotide-binding protein